MGLLDFFSVKKDGLKPPPSKTPAPGRTAAPRPAAGGASPSVGVSAPSRPTDAALIAKRQNAAAEAKVFLTSHWGTSFANLSLTKYEAATPNEPHRLVIQDSANTPVAYIYVVEVPVGKTNQMGYKLNLVGAAPSESGFTREDNDELYFAIKRVFGQLIAAAKTNPPPNPPA